MKTNPYIFIGVIILSGVLAVSSAWATTGSCQYAANGGSGMGGTGIIARGTGMGGTGITPDADLANLKLAGIVISSRGAVEARINGRTRLLAQGDQICVGETIVTPQSGMAQIRMVDDGLIAIQPQTELKIEKFSYSGTEQDSSLISLLKGTSRFVTGKLGKLHPQNDLIHTPYATIGVRGTDHVASVILPDNSAGYEAGTYDKVDQGITFIKTDKGEIDIHPNQVGMAVNMDEAPSLLNSIPYFYREDHAVKDKGDQSGQGKTGLGSAERNMDEPTRDETGKVGEIAHPSETESVPVEHPAHSIEMEIPESSNHLEIPHLPEMQETPSLPHLPDTPTMPES